LGDSIGMYDVAESLVEGRGVKADPPASVAWFRRAAEAGHFGAMAQLAKIYGEGLYGVKPDPAQAAEWARRAE
jgi:TPR repeat protein